MLIQFFILSLLKIFNGMNLINLMLLETLTVFPLFFYKFLELTSAKDGNAPFISQNVK